MEGMMTSACHECEYEKLSALHLRFRTGGGGGKGRSQALKNIENFCNIKAKKAPRANRQLTLSGSNMVCSRKEEEPGPHPITADLEVKVWGKNMKNNREWATCTVMATNGEKVRARQSIGPSEQGLRSQESGVPHPCVNEDQKTCLPACSHGTSALPIPSH